MDSTKTHATEAILHGLNLKQREAVTSTPHGRLQIIAGPGTGKTKVLVSRVAHLILAANIPPENIIVTTFTKKAANEMIERLNPIFQDSDIDHTKILIGTFHSICYRIIRRYGAKLGLNNFTIADDRDSSSILQDVIRDLDPSDIKYLESCSEEDLAPFKGNSADSGKYHGFEPKSFRRQISKLKSSGISVVSYKKQSATNFVLSFVYQKYQSKLEKEFLLDFDDCLLSCHLLISRYPVLNFVQHVLVDEFQDTNEIQLQLMYEFARGHSSNPLFQHNLTIVGDPDQSIYAFRDAQSINFKKMKHYYDTKLQLPCNSILLNENYRSTSDILIISESIMRQQSDRALKNLKSQHITSFKPVHNTLGSAGTEARWISYQINYLKSLPNEIFKFSDMAILVRSAFQTRAIENEFVKAKIPYHMVRGKAFWDRKEVVAILDYLRVVANPNDRIAYIRTLAFPKKGVGEKTLEQINDHLNKCDFKSNTVHFYLQDMVMSKKSNKISSVIQEHLSLIHRFRLRMADMECNKERENLLESFFQDLYVESNLKKEFSTDEDREGNIMEVQRQLMEYIPRDEEINLYIGGNEDELIEDDRNHLSKFITSIGLYETSDDEDQSEDKHGKVSISTIHGSKGLEWPIVFVPGLSEGLLPSRFVLEGGSEEAVNEERRCFYVATTRAKVLLFLTSIIDSADSSQTWMKPLTKKSRFIDKVCNSCSDSLECFREHNRLKELYAIRGIDTPMKENFDFDLYSKSYKNMLQPYLKDRTMTLDPFNYTEEASKALGFTTAKHQFDQKHMYEQIVEARKKLQAKRKKPTSITSMLMKTSFKPHNITPKLAASSSSATAFKSTAPKYNYSGAGSVAHSAPRGKKAPAYIATRNKTK
ncbi:ATP-dependent DNA helicase srs2 [Yamadazyma tenuis]|uniref:ATP-dependent DNA helicase srs2 n=1 Tax=Candida tenuis TaxID=2315449 RepID=UPI0027A03C70|nr:ATP-dependent DNA helicase srs2 [Yamadazyma tenuis]